VAMESSSFISSPSVFGLGNQSTRFVFANCRHCGVPSLRAQQSNPCHCERSEAIQRRVPQARPRLHAYTTSATADLRHSPLAVRWPLDSSSKTKVTLRIDTYVLNKFKATGAVQIVRVGE